MLYLRFGYLRVEFFERPQRVARSGIEYLLTTTGNFRKGEGDKSARISHSVAPRFVRLLGNVTFGWSVPSAHRR